MDIFYINIFFAQLEILFLKTFDFLQPITRDKYEKYRRGIFPGGNWGGRRVRLNTARHMHESFNPLQLDL